MKLAKRSASYLLQAANQPRQQVVRQGSLAAVFRKLGNLVASKVKAFPKLANLAEVEVTLMTPHLVQPHHGAVAVVGTLADDI